MLERVLHVFLRMFAPAGGGKDDGLRGQLVIGSAVNLAASTASGVASIFVRSLYAIGWIALWFLVLFCLTSAWHVVYEEHPQVVIRMVEYYNARVGPFVHAYLVLPLDLLNLLFKGLVPVYNGLLWVGRTLWRQGLLPILWDQVEVLMEGGVVLLNLGRHFTGSLVAFVQGLWSCNLDACVLEQPPVLDMMSPMGDVRMLAVLGGRLGGSVCSLLAVPIDLLLYPLLDANLAQGVHHGVNAGAQLLIHVPRATKRRCELYGFSGGAQDVLMCTPDLEPVFTHSVAAVRAFGVLIDNWIGLAAAMAGQTLSSAGSSAAEKLVGGGGRRRLLGVESASCTTASRALSPETFRAGGLLGGAMTVVGLTDWLMAATNGSMAYFYGQLNSDAAPRVWADGNVDVGMGVAAVAFSDVGELDVSTLSQGRRPGSRQTTTLMGCRCEDGASGGIRVRCQFAPLSSSTVPASERGMDVWFQDQVWASRLTCASVEISVRSVRWPVRRYEGKTVAFGAETVDLPTTDCLSRGTCESVDATIWLVPRCDLLPAEQCSDAAVGTSCFPFCMAARVSGSRNANPVFANADTWRSGRQVLMRDCARQEQAPAAAYDSFFLREGGGGTTLSYGQTTLSGATGGAQLFVRGDGSTCGPGVNMASWVPKPADNSGSQPSYVRRKGQPFAIAGDAILLELPQGDGGALVEVDRLTGNQRDEYTLAKGGWENLPAAPKRLVPISELRKEDVSGRLVVPLDYVATRVLATSSRNYVFYAVNPDLQVFEAYLDYCRDKTGLPRLQLMALSSYGPLRVYRVRAYCQENCMSPREVLSAQYTFDGFSNGTFTAESFPQDCGRVYNASIDGLEYVNEQNIAVVVQVADRSYDVSARRGVNSTYQTYWLNPRTMEVRGDSMWPIREAVAASLTASLPCGVGDGVPHLGTLGAEVLAAGIHAAKAAVGGAVSAPGLVAMWRGGGACPLESRGHSVLETCGEDAFSLVDFFDSLDDATGVFWGIPVWVSDQLNQGKVVEYSPVGDLLQGLGVYGRGTVGVTDMAQGGGVMSLLNTPLPEQIAGVWALMRQPGSPAGAAKIAAGASSWARYSARYFAKLAVDVSKVVLVSAGAVDVAELWRKMVGALYDLRPYYKSSVTDRAYSACLGLEIMLGGANPWGRLVYQGCKGSAAILEGAMDLVIHIFVDAPMVKCVCRDSATHSVGKYAREYCAPNIPVTLRPVLLGMIAAAESGGLSDNLLCPAVIDFTRRQLSGSMEPFFSSTYAMLDALGDSVDYALIGFDEDAGQCMNFRQDPQVVVLMPEPVDYFHACGRTSSCQTKCSGTWAAFREEVSKRDSSSLLRVLTVEQNVESLFFPTAEVDMVAPGKVVALTEPRTCGVAAGCRTEAEGCVAAAFAVGGESISVRFFCIPRSPSASVYASVLGFAKNWEAGEMTGGTVTQVGFVDSEGGALAVMVGTDLIYLLRKGRPSALALKVDQIFSLALQPGNPVLPLRILSFMPVGANLLVNVAVRTSAMGKYEREVNTVLLDLFGGTFGFPAVINPPMKEVWDGYAVSEYPPESANSSEATLLLWPSTTTGSVRRLKLRMGVGTAQIASLEPYSQGGSLAAKASLMPRNLVLSKILRVKSGYLGILASSGNTYGWLQMLRLSGSNLALSGASLGSSQTVSATVSLVTGCDGLDCRGCPDLKLRSLCSAFQSCAVFRCVGTPVNLKRPLCGVGQALRSSGMLGVEMVHGGWLMFVDVFMILLQLSTQRNVPGVEVSFPEDAFLGNLCAAKDLSAEFFSILTSTVNSALQLAQTPPPLMQSASRVDSAANTLLSMSTAAVTGMLHQVALAPMYALAVGHKVVMCKVSGMLALTSAAEFHVTLHSARFAGTDAIGGACMTMGAEVKSMQTGDSSALTSVGGAAAEMLSNSGGQRIVMSMLEPVMHVVDGALAYAIGAVGKFADVLQTFDMQHCVMPDVTLKRAAQCACGDQALAISAARRTERGMWCSGALSLVDSSNRVRVVWNPYTYQELQDRLAGTMDAFLEEAGSDASASAPNDEVFARQGVSIIAVLTRCRQNYVNGQWDPAAYVAYDQYALDREVTSVTPAPTAADPGDGAGACLLESAAKGAGNGACLSAFLKARGEVEATYWAYEQSNATAAHLVDACMVFSGPAENVGVPASVRKVFRECLSGYATTSSKCDLSGFVWSPASSNDVPVAARHVIKSTEAATVDAVGQRMRAASDLVMGELDKLAEYNNAELEAAVFSAEGDVVHQLMDCVFMGPFARVDYWPAPRCNESETPDCLVGPYWSRDAGRGATRNIDLDECPADDTLPFTCGSPTRRAMIRDFVKRYLQGGQSGSEMLVTLIQGWLSDQRELWRNASKFGCDCPAGNGSNSTTNDVRCCRADGAGGYLPALLSRLPLNLPTKGVMNAIEKRVQYFYAEAMRDPGPWMTELSSDELSKYDWAASTGAHRVETDARYDVTKPTRSYTKAEAMSPPMSYDNQGLWQTCHAALKQVMFTLPLGDEGQLRDAVPDFPGGGPEAIAAHVKLLVQSAYEASPLFWHYQPRHHPSESRMCEEEQGGNLPENGEIHFGDYRVNGNLILDGQRLKAVRSLGFDAAPIGAWNHSCFCGWRKTTAGMCVVPAGACEKVPGASECLYKLETQDVRALELAYTASGGGWPCPLLALSEHLGFLDPAATEMWLRGAVNLTTSGEFVLRYGPGGLKVGNAPVRDGATMELGLGADFVRGDLGEALLQYLTPVARKVDPGLAVLSGCRAHLRSTNSLLDEFVDGLFPMAQGVAESGVGSYCLRFAIEMARLRALELIPGVERARLVRQKDTMAAWRKRCGVQVQLVGMCSALDLYKSMGSMTASCTQGWKMESMQSSAGMYTTPECLLSINGVFYDPCDCNPDWCISVSVPVILTREQVEGNPACRLRFDPRTVVRSAELGWWGLDEVDPAAAASNAWLENSWNLLDLEGLKDGLLARGGVGNVHPGANWASAEGFMNETGLFCDMIADYWPEDAMFPVGYHVSVPCDKDEAGYRSFDNVFAVEYADDGSPRMVYMEDQTRDGDLVDSHMGAGGLCRGTNFGFDMYETNTMRACTRTFQGEDVDVHVPKGPNDPGKLGLPRCSASSTELPWADERYYDYYDAAFYSVGTVPNLPSAEAKFYPETADRYMRLGPQHDMEGGVGWGESCQDFEIPDCEGTWKCPDGFVCRGGGVCQHQSVECTRHDECAADKMCSGVGTCVTPKVTVENQMDANVSFRAHTADCAGESFSMRGASHWGYVPDLLEAHGMCSYRHWQEYLYTLGHCNCSGGGSNSDSCLMNASQCPYYTFSKQQDSNMWWNPVDRYPSRLKILPTTCDRDYERFSLGGREMQSCVPGKAKVKLMGPDRAFRKFAERDSMWKLYDGDTKAVPVRLMPFRAASTYGFLGYASEPSIKSCTSVQQCYIDDFTKNGVVSMLEGRVRRPNRRLLDGSLYNPDHTFRCGVIGFFNDTTGMCHVDRKLFPLYHLMCFGTNGVDNCLSSMGISQNELASRCMQVMDPYPQEYNIIHDVNVPALAALFTLFKSPSTLQGHMDTLKCMNYIYGSISKPPFESKGLYLPFTFTVYEVPFPWFYQCMVGAQKFPETQSFNILIYRCPTYESRVTLSAFQQSLQGSIDFSSYIFKVRAGYNETSLLASLAQQRQVAEATWKEAVEELRALLFPKENSSSVDRTYPMCYTEKRYDLPNSNFNKLRLIETFERQSCSSNVRGEYLTRYRNEMNNPPGLNLMNIIDELTVNTGELSIQTPNTKPLLTGRIRDFGLSQLLSKATTSKLLASSAPVRYDWGMPSLDSSEYKGAKQQWKQTQGYLPMTVDLANPAPTGCPENRVYIYKGNPKFEMYDSDQMAGFKNSWVDACPLYTTGKFGCHYAEVTINSEVIACKGSDPDVEASFDEYTDALYQEVRRRYENKMQSRGLAPIEPENVAFFEEESALGFGEFSFNLSRVSRYMNNIDPDPKTPIMCTAGNQTIDYNECTDSNFKALRDHVRDKYVKDAGVVVPVNFQLDWEVSKGMMAGGSIFSFSSVPRNVSKQYMGRLFDEELVCQAARLSHTQRLCSFSSSGSLATGRSVSPWMSGWWNPYDKCDVQPMDADSGNQEKINVECHMVSFCPPESGLDPKVAYYRDMPYNLECIRRNEELTSHLNVDASSDYNLCRHLLVEDPVCMHKQGMLGGTDGMPMEDSNVSRDLYALHEFTKFPEGDGAAFGNVLLAGKSSDYGFVRIPLAHIGGHHLGMVVVNGSLRVSRLPLKPVDEAQRMSSWDTKTVSEWVEGWSASLDADGEGYRTSVRNVGFVLGLDAEGAPRFGWSCPLKRRAFYGGNVSGFGPSLPSARRSRRLFGNMTGGRYAHPTQARGDGSGQFGRYLSTNGFCFCPMSEEVWPGMCSVKTEMGEGHNCSLYSTVKAIKGEAWGWSHTFRPKTAQNEFKTCGVQVDWPFVRGTLRDGGTLLDTDVSTSAWAEASDMEARRCHVLDRIPDFAYVYASKLELKPSGFTTLDRGVCHTGRVQGKARGEGVRCVRTSKNSLTSTLKCVNNSQFTVERRRSALPDEMANRAKFSRRACSRCSPPPKFRTRGGRDIKAESSFGVPYRASAERVLAQDLREALCGAAANRSECVRMLVNESAWVPGEFLRTYLRNPAGLFKPGVVSLRDALNVSLSYLPRPHDQPDDSALWARQWVYCPSKEALKTGRGCNGSISKERWRKDKVKSCYATLEGALKGAADPMARTEVCELDSRLTGLCKAIREAQSLVASANCLASGNHDCALQEFVYSPSTWETSNQAFVHQTVEEFYKRSDPECSAGGSDCVCKEDATIAALRLKNAELLRECSAVPVMVFQEVLRKARDLVFPLCRSMAYVVNIGLNMVLTMIPSMHGQASNQIMKDFLDLRSLTSETMDQLSDLIFTIAFQSGRMGPWLRSGIVNACGIVNTGYAYFADFWCNLLVQQFPVFLGALKSIAMWVDVGFEVVNDIFMLIIRKFLPESIMDLANLGYVEHFQSTRYKDKQKVYEARLQADLGNPSQNRPLSDAERQAIAEKNRNNKALLNLVEARDRNQRASSKNVLLSTVNVLGRAGEVFNFATMIYDAFQQAETAKMIMDALKNFPTQFTLFDFDTFYMAIDALLEFINSDFTCYTMDTQREVLNCEVMYIPEPNSSDVRLTSPRATSCWAEAQHGQIGVSTLYSCSATSTCCADPLNCDDPSGALACGDCPLPPAGVRTFGCNTMIQKCQCGLQSYEVDRCVAQRECGPSSSCSLLTSLDDVSFGSLKSCTDCASSPICLVGGSQHYGECTCLSSPDAQVALCDSGSGARVNPDASKLCGYSVDSGVYFAWSEISLVLCANAISPVCVEVVEESGASIFMPVATKLRGLQVTYGGRRRLLEASSGGDSPLPLPSIFSPGDPVDDLTPDTVHRAVTGLSWNHSSAPCSTLAHAYREGHPLGPLDESALHSCVYWRAVGRQVIEEFELSTMAGLDTFLLSPDDLSSALGQQGVVEELMKKPRALLTALMFSPWLKPLRAVLAVASRNANVSRTISGWARGLSRIKNRRNADIHSPDARMNESGRVRGRRLMGVFEDTEAEIRLSPFYPYVKALVANFSASKLPNASSTRSGFAVSQTWLRESFAWKPVVFGGSCAAAEALGESIGKVLTVVKSYYEHFLLENVKRVASNRLRDVIPSFKAPPNVTFPEGISVTSVRSTGTGVFDWTLGAVRMSRADLLAFLSDPCPGSTCAEANRWTLTYMVESYTFCSFESVMYCGAHKRGLVPSLVFSLILFAVAYSILSYMGLSLLGAALFAALPAFVLWFSIGVAPSCFPMLPTCLLDDLIDAIRGYIPVEAAVPRLLIPVNSSDIPLRSCSELHFTGWEDPLVFALCDMGFCDGLDDANYLGIARLDFAQKREMCQSADADAYRLCSTVSAARAVPVIMALSVALALASSAILTLFTLVAPSLSLAWQVSVYNHAKGDDNINN